MSDVNKQLLEALAQLDLAETEVINAKAWSAGEQAKKHCDFALTAIATARQAIAAAEQAQQASSKCATCQGVGIVGHSDVCMGCINTWQTGDSPEQQAAPQAVATGWIDPNDKTQKQFLPHIGEPVLFCCDGVTYHGIHTGGSFKTGQGVTAQLFGTWDCMWMYPPTAAVPKGGK